LAPAAQAAADAAAPPAPGTPLVNPRLRIDPALNLVVLEFRDEGGDIRSSIPTPREIQAYRQQAAQVEEEGAAEETGAVDVRR
jgi:hypothetical protein